MDIRTVLAAGLLAACAAPACAQHATTLPPVRAGALFVADCAHPALPSQRQVGEWTGLHNFGQVYAAREQLMGDISRACRRPGAGHVQLVRQSGRRGDAGRRPALAFDVR